MLPTAFTKSWVLPKAMRVSKKDCDQFGIPASFLTQDP
jgi:hypothetical protein